MIFGSQSGEQVMTPPGDIRAYDVVDRQAACGSFDTIPATRRARLRDDRPKRCLKLHRRRQQLGRDVDRRSRAASSTSRPGRGPTTSTAPIARATTCSPTASLALDAKTGKRLWHFQTVHHDLWDCDNVAGAAARHRAPTNGKKIDDRRARGQDGLPLRVRSRAPASRSGRSRSGPLPPSDVPGEKSSPTQPLPTKPRAVRAAERSPS